MLPMHPHADCRQRWSHSGEANECPLARRRPHEVANRDGTCVASTARHGHAAQVPSTAHRSSLRAATSTMPKLLPRFVSSALLLTALSAQTDKVTFQEPGLVAMSNSAGSIVPATARLSTQFLTTLGVTFSSTGGFVAVVNHGASTPSAPNIVGGTTAAGALSYLQPITVRFFDPADPTEPATTDWFRVRGDLVPLNTGTGTVQAFSVDGTLLGSQTLNDVSPGMVFTLSFALPGIHRVVITETSGTVGWDDVEFSPVRRAANYAPFGAGCPGTLGVPVLAAATGSLPLPGTTFHATITGAPNGLALMATGFSNAQSGGTPLPASLAGVGMPSCDLLVELLLLEVVSATGTTVAWSLPLPPGAALLGLRFFQQGFVVDPAANALGLAASNGASATIGS